MYVVCVYVVRVFSIHSTGDVLTVKATALYFLDLTFLLSHNNAVHTHVEKEDRTKDFDKSSSMPVHRQAHDGWLQFIA